MSAGSSGLRISKKALAQQTKFVKKVQLNELEEQGVIQAYEYTNELAWNVMKDFLEYKGQADIFGSRDAIRKAFQLELIHDGDRWMEACELAQNLAYLQ